MTERTLSETIDKFELSNICMSEHYRQDERLKTFNFFNICKHLIRTPEPDNGKLVKELRKNLKRNEKNVKC